MHSLPAGETPPVPGGPLGRLLLDPWSAIHTLASTAWSWCLIAAPPLVVWLAVVAIARHWWWRYQQARLHTHARTVTILAPPTVDLDGAQTLWFNLVGLLRPAWKRILTGQPHLAFELVFSHDGVAIQLWVPGVIPPGMVERAIEAAWPGAHTRTSPASSPLPTDTAPGRQRLATGGELRLARSEALPIRSEFPTDPLRALLGAPVGLGVEDHACIQLLIRPVTGHRVAKARRAGRHLHAGRSTHLIGRILDLLTPGPTRLGTTNPALDPQTSLAFAAQDRAIVAKQLGPHWETVLRYALTTALPTPAEHASRASDQLRGRAHALASALSTFTGHNHYRRTRLRHPLTVLHHRHLRRGDLLSIPELAALAHLPTDEAIPGLARAGARAVPPPPNTPTTGPLIKPLGISDTGHARPVGLYVSDARHHLHVLGATGSGKSTLLARMILADADHGRGAVVIDPKGDLVTDILMRLPEHAASRLVLLDAGAPGPVPCLNPLEGPKDAAIDNLVSVFSRVFASAWGPRTDDILRAACLTLRAGSPHPTLAQLPGLLTDPATRTRLRDAVADPVLRGFWDWYERLSDGARAQAIAPLLNKLRAFLLRPFVVKAIAAGPSTMDMTTVLDGGLCLVRIPKGSLGEDTTRLIGSLVVARVWQAATARANLPQRQRRDAGLYIDEAQNFLHLPHAIDDMLAEARGYRLAMILAHQHLGQLSRELNEGISTNARSKVFFTAGPQDARELARHTAPRLSEHDLSHLGAFHAAARLVVNGEETQPFTLRTEDLPPAIPGRAATVRAAAQEQLILRQQRPVRRNATPDEDIGDPPAPDPRRVA